MAQSKPIFIDRVPSLEEFKTLEVYVLNNNCKKYFFWINFNKKGLADLLFPLQDFITIFGGQKFPTLSFVDCVPIILFKQY